MEESILMWNRLESSLRNETQIENALRFEIRDAVWMLTRQWQFGEFEGEDAGKAAFVRTTIQQSPVIVAGPDTLPVQPFNFHHSPLEMAIEREVLLPDLADRLEMGRHWERLLKKRLPAAQAPAIIQAFRQNERFQFSTQLPKEPDRETRFKNAQKYSDDGWLLTIEALSGGRAMDGFVLLVELRSGKSASHFLPQADAAVNQVGLEFVQWFERVYGQTNIKNSWHPQHLEYQPQIAFNGTDGNPQVLRKEEYFGDGLEWNGFTSKTTWDNKNALPLPAAIPAVVEQTVIPSAIRFRGMPATRLWQLEDSQVDFGAIRSAPTELNKMLFADYGLVYGNDWLIAPVQLSCGTLCRMAGMVITDNFGVETVVQEITPNAEWAFFQTQAAEAGKRWLFLATGSDYFQEGQPVEQVLFLRDEMANMVWAVEEKIPSPYGGGRSGENLAKQTAQLVRSLDTSEETKPEGQPLSEGWMYKAGTLMAENRIPFIPLAVDLARQDTLGKRKVVLQRAAIPRVSDDFDPIRIRPRTVLLGNTGKLESEKPAPLFCFEEEVPRSGMELSLVWKRVRWFDGQTLIWLAKRKAIGKGEVDANFRFDILKK